MQLRRVESERSSQQPIPPLHPAHRPRTHLPTIDLPAMHLPPRANVWPRFADRKGANLRL